MEIDLRRHLETCASEFGKLTGREPSTVARLSTGDWRFFDRIAEGASFTARKYDSVMGWFSANWPPEAKWPDAVPRPTIAANDASARSEAA